MFAFNENKSSKIANYANSTSTIGLVTSLQSLGNAFRIKCVPLPVHPRDGMMIHEAVNAIREVDKDW